MGGWRIDRFVDGWWVVLFQLLSCNLHFDLMQVAAPYPTMAGYPKPDYPAPHSFIALVVTVTIICGLLDLLSLAFGIPAIICALIVSKQN